MDKENEQYSTNPLEGEATSLPLSTEDARLPPSGAANVTKTPDGLRSTRELTNLMSRNNPGYSEETIQSSTRRKKPSLAAAKNIYITVREDLREGLSMPMSWNGPILANDISAFSSDFEMVKERERILIGVSQDLVELMVNQGVSHEIQEVNAEVLSLQSEMVKISQEHYATLNPPRFSHSHRSGSRSIRSSGRTQSNRRQKALEEINAITRNRG